MNGLNRDIKCLDCSLSKFGNFSHIENEEKGGELYILKKTIELNKLIPCELSIPLDCCFQLWLAIQNYVQEKNLEYSSMDDFFETPESDKENINLIPLIGDDDEVPTTPLLFFIYPCFSDLKASIFLALSGHYRPAIQLLRPTIENVLVGRCIEEKIKKAAKKKNPIKKIKKGYDEFFQWSSETRILDFNSSMQYLENENIFIEGEGSRLKSEIWMELNKFMHPHLSKWSDNTDPALTQYSITRLEEWIYLYENILTYIMETLYIYYPVLDDMQMANDALDLLSEWYRNGKERNNLMIKHHHFDKLLAKKSNV